MSKPKQRRMLFFFIVMYVGIAVTGFGIAYYVKTAFFSHAQSFSQSTTAKQVVSVETSPTPTGWRLYTNTAFNLAFSYPPTDVVQTKQYGFGVSSSAFQSKNGNVDFQILFLPKTLASAVGQDFDSYYTMPNNATQIIKSPLSQDNTTEKFAKINDRTVNGNEALDYQSRASNANPNSQPEIGTFIEVGDNLVLISTAQSNKQKLEDMLETFHYPQK